MDYLYVTAQLESNRETFRALFEGKSREHQTWKGDPEQWSLLGILCHLADEELLDFRARCEHILTTPELGMARHRPGRLDRGARLRLERLRHGSRGVPCREGSHGCMAPRSGESRLGERLPAPKVRSDLRSTDPRQLVGSTTTTTSARLPR